MWDGGQVIPSAEGKDVEFKLTPKSVGTEDLVAFANSRDGGVIFVGVREDRTKGHFDDDDIVGCDCRDQSKLTILNKAQDCVPPVAVDVSVETNGHVNYLRVDIPSSWSKPHCTGKGTYTIRGDGRTNPLDPLQLLEVFVTRESDVFLSRFAEATGSLETRLDDMGKSLVEQYASVADQVALFQERLEDSLDHIGENSEDAANRSDEASGTVDVVSDQVGTMADDLMRLGWSLGSLDDKVDRLACALLDEPGLIKVMTPDVQRSIAYLRRNYTKSRKLPKTVRAEIVTDLQEQYGGISAVGLGRIYDEFAQRG